MTKLEQMALDALRQARDMLVTGSYQPRQRGLYTYIMGQVRDAIYKLEQAPDAPMPKPSPLKINPEVWRNAANK